MEQQSAFGRLRDSLCTLCFAGESGNLHFIVKLSSCFHCQWFISLLPGKIKGEKGAVSSGSSSYAFKKRFEQIKASIMHCIVCTSLSFVY